MSEELTDDPRFEGMPAEVVDNAKKAKCARCEEVVVEAASMRGTVMVNYYVPALGKRDRVILCGMCGLAFREFIYPYLLDNPQYQAAKAALVEGFSG